MLKDLRTDGEAGPPGVGGKVRGGIKDIGLVKARLRKSYSRDRHTLAAHLKPGEIYAGEGLPSQNQKVTLPANPVENPRRQGSAEIPMQRGHGARLNGSLEPRTHDEFRTSSPGLDKGGYLPEIVGEIRVPHQN